jgi:indolepyruvate ferredoxin oxidoreductase beta subunit
VKDLRMSEQAPRRITIAVLAMGGEGGGVLADWIVDLAEHTGYLVQTTSIPGVAQRTGATNYYLELFPRAAAQAAGRVPVLGLTPVPGDVDIVVASELMEAARAVQRGLVTPDRTTLIASTHRVYAMTEKIALADGRVDSDAMLEACRTAAKQLIACDMAALAEATNSVISSVLFGALAGAGTLPAQRMAFEAAIRRGGVGVKDSLNAFAAGFSAAEGGVAPAAPTPAGDALISTKLAALLVDANAFPFPAQEFVRAGVERLIDYQDADYARLYLTRLTPLIALEQRHGDGSGRLLAETARELALGMAYEDTVRVAELKIRPAASRACARR